MDESVTTVTAQRRAAAPCIPGLDISGHDIEQCSSPVSSLQHAVSVLVADAPPVAIDSHYFSNPEVTKFHFPTPRDFCENLIFRFPEMPGNSFLKIFQILVPTAPSH